MSKTVAFLLQTNYTLHLTIPVAYYAQARGHAVVDFTSDENFDIMGLERGHWDQYDLVIPYGSVQMLTRFRNTPLGHHIKYQPNGYSTEHWMTHFGERALNHQGKVMQAHEALAHLHAHERAHVRPDAEGKAFIAQLFDADSWLAHVAERNVRDDLSVFVSPPQVLEREYRCWVVDGNVVEISQYMEYGVFGKALVEDPVAHAGAQSLAEVYQPANAFVMDIVKTPEGFKLIEFNNFHCAGWYAGRVDRVMDAYLDSLLRRY